MIYVTQAGMESRFGLDELVARTNRAGGSSVDAEVLARALGDADAEIDGYLAARYALPLPTVPPVLARIACDIARYRLWEDLASEEVRRRYEDARRLLEAISRGTVSLGLPAGLPPASQPQLAMAAASGGPAPVFSRAGTSGY